MLTFMIPSGIGDFAAMYTKLCCLEREMTVIATMDGPHRISPFLDILPAIRNGGYGNFTTGICLNYALAPGTDLRTIEDGEYFLACNSWMDYGGKMADWCPGPINYHYPFSTPKQLLELAHKRLQAIREQHNGPVIGVYTSGHGNSQHWGFWQAPEWLKFMQLLRTVCNAHFVFIGAVFDLDLGSYLYALSEEAGVPCTSAIGETHIGTAVELMRGLDYFFIFPSGLGFLADVVNVPHIMWFPKHLETMHGTFCDPVNYESHQSMHRIFESPEDAFQAFKQYGLAFVEERICQQKR